MPNDPTVVEQTLANIPQFLARIVAIVDPDRIILHEARWATGFKSADGTIQPFRNLEHIRDTNRILDRYHDRMKSTCPRLRTIRVADEHVLGDEAHRWTLEPFHYAEDYYQQFLIQLDTIAPVQVGNASAGMPAARTHSAA